MECKHCGAELETGLAICPECGARQQRRLKRVQCRHCGAKVSAQLVVCPACGRELRPARLRGWGWLALGIALVAVLTLIFSGRLRFDLDSWRQRSAERLQVAASWLAEAPAVVLPTVILPPTPTPTPSPTPTATPTVTPVFTDTPIASPTPTLSPSPPPALPYRTYKVQRGDTPGYIAGQFGITAEELMAVNGITNPSALQVGQELIIPHPPTATPTLTPTPLPAASAEPSPAVMPTAALQPTATATAAGGTATPAAVLAAAPTATLTLTATPTATLTPTAAPTATATTQPVAVATATETGTYIVQPGDSPDSIARRFGITAQALMAANGITDPTRLRVGQKLVIPPAGATPPPLPTPTPQPATPTPQPTPMPTVTIRFQAPVLTNPGDGTPYSGETSFIELKWESVGTLDADEGYIVYVGIVVADEQTEWVHEQFVQETAWRVEAWLHGRAPQEFGRRYRWYVQVMRVSRDAAGDVLRDDAGKIVGQPVSPESESRLFIWH